MNSLDVEIMWTLKQSLNHYVLSTEITEINPQIVFNETTKERLRYLTECKYVDEYTIHGTEIRYRLTAKGVDFIWDGKLKQRILNILSTGDYSMTQLSRLLGESRDDIKKEINHMQDETPSIVTRYDKERTRYIKITTSGKNYLEQNNNSNSNTNLAHNPKKVKIYPFINIQNITSEFDKLLIEINNESNLSPVEKEFLTKSIIDTSRKISQLKEDFEVFGGKFTRNMLKSFLGTYSSTK